MEGESPIVPSATQQDTLDVLEDAVRHVGQDDEDLSAREAASALLKVRLDYSSEKSGTTSMASYGGGDLSLPDTVVGAPLVNDVVSSDARVFLRDIRQRMLRSDSSLAEEREGRPRTVPYMDQVLHHPIHQALTQSWLGACFTYKREDVSFSSSRRRTDFSGLYAMLGESTSVFLSHPVWTSSPRKD